MGSIVLQIDDETSQEYDGLATERKDAFLCEANSLLKKTCKDARLDKLNQIIGQINNEQTMEGINIDLLLRLLPLD